MGKNTLEGGEHYGLREEHVGENTWWEEDTLGRTILKGRLGEEHLWGNPLKGENTKLRHFHDDITLGNTFGKSLNQSNTL